MSEDFPETEINEAAHSIVGDSTTNDHLFNDDGAAQAPEVDIPAMAEIQKDPYLEDIFEPLIIKSRPPEFNYDQLFADDQKEVDIDPQTGMRRKSPEEIQEDYKRKAMVKRTAVTERSLSDARPVLAMIQHDPFIGGYIAQYLSTHPEANDPTVLAAALRQDKDLRYAVGSRLLDVVNKIPNTEPLEDTKKPNHPGYQDSLSPSLYMALLALSMADATFKREYENHLSPSDGRHRRGAGALLDYINRH